MYQIVRKLFKHTISDFNDKAELTAETIKKQIFLAGWKYWAHSVRYGIIIAVGIRTPVS
jgi:hypothetical protein